MTLWIENGIKHRLNNTKFFKNKSLFKIIVKLVMFDISKKITDILIMDKYKKYLN